MSEKSLWTHTRKHVQETIQKIYKKAPYHIMRIENAVYSGTPDVNICVDGKETWLELKHIEEWPARDTTLVRVPHFTRQQRCWLHDRCMAGGKAYVWLSVGHKDYLLIDGLDASMHLGKVTKEELILKAELHYEDKKINWDQFIKHIMA